MEQGQTGDARSVRWVSAIRRTVRRVRPGSAAAAQKPKLRNPVMIVAFEGWNDAGEAASYAAAYLERSWSAVPFAEIDPEEFFDFTEVRPEVALDADNSRTIKWPVTTFSLAAAGTAESDVILVRGCEPQLRWRTYSEAFIEIARGLGIERVITLGAYLGEVTHGRPVPVTTSSNDAALAARLGLSPSLYEGPTGIVGVLAASLAEARIPSISVWASVPCYSLPVTPKGALALARVVSTLSGRSADLTELEVESADYEARMDELVEDDEAVAAYVERIEEIQDSVGDAVSSDALAEEIERFLRGGRSG